MFVHPLVAKPVPAGGGGGLDFTDNFDGYVTGEALSATSGSPYTLFDGIDNGKLRDMSGTDVVRFEGNPAIYTYTDAVAGSREVSLTLHQASDTVGATVELFLSISNYATDYISFTYESSGRIRIRQEVSNVRTTFLDTTLAAPTNGDVLFMSLDTGTNTFVCKRNGSTLSLTGSITPITMAAPGFRGINGTVAANGTAIRQFTVKEL